MPGSISLSMSQQFKRSGAYAVPLSGGKLYTIQAGTTSAPQSAYQDFALTIPHPNPIILDESGYIPPFYLDDGFIKIRLDDADGLTIRNVDNLLVIGPSSGEGGGSGGGVDPTTVFQTGWVMWQPMSGSIAGWVRDNGRTIGSATSGATERANADCEALFLWLWNKYSNTFCPVSTGRGVSAAADWSANKTIQLLNLQNCVPCGLDDMGATAAGGFDGVPVVTGDVTTAGSIIGETTHQLLKAELPTDKPTGTVAITDPGHTHTVSNTARSTGGNGAFDGSFAAATLTTSSATTGITAAFTGDNLGSGTAHNNMPRAVLGSFFRKL